MNFCHSVCMHLHIHGFFFCTVSVCISSLHRPHLFRKQTEESLDWQCTFGVRVHILWTIAQQKRDDCMIRPRQAILCLFEEEGAPSSPEQVFLRLSSPPAPRAPIATVSWWKFPKKSVRYSIKFPSYSWHIFFSSKWYFFFKLTQSDTQCRWRAGSVNGLLLTLHHGSMCAFLYFPTSLSVWFLWYSNFF